MLTTVMPESSAGFNVDSVPLLRKDAIARHRAWTVGDTVMSNMVSVGAVPLTPKVLALLSRRQFGKQEYDFFDECPPELDETVTALRAIVQADADRGDLYGFNACKARGGGYCATRHREPWHVDGFGHASVRWALADGVGSTVGLNGPVEKSQFDDASDMLPEYCPEVNEDLTILSFPLGEVLRFMNSCDPHAGPYGNGARMLLTVTANIAD